MEVDMQVFVLDHKDISKTFDILDIRRLCKQRCEGWQVFCAALGISNKRWQNHPCTKLWKDYLPYLVFVYLRLCMKKWKLLGCDNTKSNVNFWKMVFHLIIRFKWIPRKPKFIDKDFVLRHRSNLIRKEIEKQQKIRDEYNKKEKLSDDIEYSLDLQKKTLKKLLENFYYRKLWPNISGNLKCRWI